ncbi:MULTISPECIES: hypothetical protein [unclassified Microbacterium]|uniref:hypothetical protein n=1 Tax=unclassified Microbacterium TaxID=2609290 RepID=UPI0016051914|nr:MULTISPECIES: hypothetical protein [unclassified Microbacterium]QNA91998.1 hypothetical protein G4G29_05310 [Microbacterium sp. Se63.02b]QYM65229.1 hypothetical protein K1X59_05345 [Microbacterium sp. Se5.02b]
MTEEIQKNKGISRRTIVKGAAWSVPVIAAAVATPLAAASVVDVGAFSVDGDCGTLGLLFPGFEITAGPSAPLPAGTVITITATGIANVQLFSISSALADIQLLGPTSQQITLVADLPAGTSFDARAVVGLGVGSTLTATATLPAGYTATGAKTSGSLSQTAILCSDS